MARIKRKRVYYGSDNTGIMTVGYQLFDAKNIPIGPRRTDGVKELLDASGNPTGTYEAKIVLPDYFEGEVRWTLDENDTVPAIDYVSFK